MGGLHEGRQTGTMTGGRQARGFMKHRGVGQDMPTGTGERRAR